MKTFVQYQKTRQIAEFLINNKINVEEYCNSITELAEQNQLNEEKLSDRVQVHSDMQTTADVMTLIAKIDTKIKTLGLKADLSQLTFGAVERAMEKWHSIRSRGGNPYEVIAKAKQNKLNDLQNNPVSSQNISGNYPAGSVSTQNITPDNTSYTLNTLEKLPKGLQGKNGKFISPKILRHTFDTQSQKAVNYFNEPKQKSLDLK